MKRMGFASMIALAALAPLVAYAEEPTVVASANAVKWSPGPPALPKGSQFALISGDPTKEGPFTYRIALPAGAKIAPHSHPNDENVTVISGTFNVGVGDKLEQGKTTAIKTGGFIHIPKGMHHFAWVSQRTVIQGNGLGPNGTMMMNYVNQADDPRNTR